MIMTKLDTMVSIQNDYNVVPHRLIQTFVKDNVKDWMTLYIKQKNCVLRFSHPAIKKIYSICLYKYRSLETCCSYKRSKEC